MKTIKKACIVRESVFDESKRDDTLDLSNLLDNSIDSKEFFKETYITEGMELLFDNAFKRFEGKASSGIIKLTQAMGGGKTHNMIALGLLAQDKELRTQILDGKYKNIDGEIRVVAYTGRESDLEYGIWGEVARQLGKEEVFKDYYYPLKAPGQSAWINLLKSDTPTLIMLDELPPYLQYIQTIERGTGTLADITVNALSNLFNAINKAELHNVCLVISDLQATYEGGSKMLKQTFKDLEGEVERSSINIEPVGANTDDLYNILRTRLFEEIATEEEISEIAIGYREAVKEAKEMRYTDISPEEISGGIISSYPFHPSIKNLFARFKENTGFQQTRDYIRLARIMVRNLYKEDGLADKRYLINPYDIDLNDSETVTFIKNIKPELSNAITNDISDQGRAMAEVIDAQSNNTNIQDLSKLILMSSLSTVSGAIIGLSMNEIVAYMAEQGRDITNLKSSLEEYRTRAWYLYSDKQNRLFFKRVQNVNAELIERTKTYSYDIAKDKIKEILEEKFKPNLKDCYQELLVFPSIEDIELKRDKVTLILTEPNSSRTGLHPDVEKFYEDSIYKNRVMFLTGQRTTMDSLIEVTKEYKAIEEIIYRKEKEEQLPADDTELIQAKEIRDFTSGRLYSTIRETFVTLHYPKGKLRSADIKMEFTGNDFNAEEQIKKLLDEVGKFTNDIEPNSLRRRFETRVFTAQRMRWIDILERTATTTEWSWHHPNALEDLKIDSLTKELWIEEGGFLDKEPPVSETSVSVREVHRDDNTGEVILKLTPYYGDTIHYEINSEATTGSLIVPDINNFKTSELKLSFLCVDSTGKSPAGKPIFWENKITIKHDIYDKDGSQYVELEASSPDVKILYSTDGSNPKENGGIYEEEVEIPKGSRFLRAVAFNEKAGIYSEERQIEIKETKIEIDRDKPVKLEDVLISTSTPDAFKLLENVKKYNMIIDNIGVNIQERGKEPWASLDMGEFEIENIDSIKGQLNAIIENFFVEKNYDINITINDPKFKTGKDFEQWVASKKSTIDSYKGKIKQ